MGLWDAVTALPEDIAKAIMDTISDSLASFIRPQLEAARVLMTANINPYDFQGLWQVIVGIISLFYLLIFLIVGLKFVFGSYDTEQRAEAKEWFKKAILLVILVNASLLLYSLMLNISSGVAGAIWSDEFEKLFEFENLSALDITYLGTLAVAIFLALLTLVVRHMFIIIGVMLFPIGLFLKFIPPTQEYGSVLINLIGAFAFMNVLDVIILTGVQMFWNEFNYLEAISTLSLIIGFLLIFFANIAFGFIAIKKAFSTVGVKINVSSLVKTLAGPAIASA
ncbi:MAG: hypothetical protein Q7K34_02375 [archaeon]|nr:hypothetical protein [archaeon]